jgi:uncharacterized membrane protein YraQ (UPF0718 family)
MLKNILQLYALVICAVAAITLFVISGMTISYLTDLMIPEYKKYSSLTQYESNEAYIASHKGLYNAETHKEMNTLNQVSALKQLSPQALTEKRLTAKKTFLEDVRRRAIENLINSFEWALVALVFFLIHWRIYKRATEKA